MDFFHLCYTQSEVFRRPQTPFGQYCLIANKHIIHLWSLLIVLVCHLARNLHIGELNILDIRYPMEYNYPKSITQSPPRSQNKMSAVHSEALIIWVMLFKTKTITGDMFVEFVSDESFFVGNLTWALSLNWQLNFAWQYVGLFSRASKWQIVRYILRTLYLPCIIYGRILMSLIIFCYTFVCK